MDLPSEFLSQDEVDALLSGAQSGGAQPSDAQPSAVQPQAQPTAAQHGVRPYDLGSPDRVVRHRMHTLELINERFARRMRNVFFSFTRRSADITVAPLRIQKYSDFERHLPVPCNLNVVAMKPLRGSSLFTFDPSLVFLVIDSLFGGHGRYSTRIEGRDFSVTEQRIIQRLLAMTLTGYAQAWEPVYAVQPDYLRSEMHTKFASITRGNEIVVVSSFQIEFGASGGTLNICLPYSMIEPLRDLLTQTVHTGGSDAIDQRWARQLSRQVRSADIALTVDFAKIDMTVAQLLQLKLGDILPITIPQTVTANAENVPVLEGTVGTSRQHYALRVQKVLQHSERDDSTAVVLSGLDDTHASDAQAHSAPGTPTPSSTPPSP